MELQEQLILNIPRENSGSISSNRFDYQKDWAFCKLLDLYKSGKDFLIILDFHEDILILNSEHKPTSLCAYQVKTKTSGNWTLTQLLQRKKGKDNAYLNSILGKLYNNKLLFKNKVAGLFLITNARFNIPLYDKKLDSINKKEICLNQLADKELSKFIESVKAEYGLTYDMPCEDIIYLTVTELSMTDSSTHSKGKLTDFLEALYPGGKFNIPLIYRAIFDEIRRKTNYEWRIESFGDIIKHKSISKSYFSEMLANMGVSTDIDWDAIWQTIEGRLNTEGEGYQSLLKIKSYWRRYEIERLDQANIILQKSRKHVKQAILICMKVSHEKLREFMNSCVQNLELTGWQSYIYDLEYTKTMILMEYHDICQVKTTKN